MNPFQTNKIYDHLDKVNQWAGGKNPFAVTMELDPTNICNHKCPGCCGFAVPSNDSLEGWLMNKVVSQAAVLGVRGVIFTGGGEPLCNKSTPHAIWYIKKVLGLPVGLITNGSLLEGCTADALVKSCDWIRISLDAGTSKQHKKTHGVSDFDIVLRNLRSLVARRNQIGSSVVIGTGYLTGKGAHDIEDMKAFVDESVTAGVDYAQFRPFLGTEEYAKQDLHEFVPIDFSELEEMGNDRTRVVNSTHKYNVMNSRPRDEKGEVVRAYEKCYGHQFATTVTATGDMTICCHTRGIPGFVLGNVREESVASIWYGSKRQAAIARIDVGKCPLLCRADSFNEILWQIKQPKNHKEFL